jgi:transcription antitermination factor NusG
MGVCGVPDSCSGSTGNETCDTAAGRPQWFLVVVRVNHERKVADRLQAKGYEVFLPMHAVRRQWGARLATYVAPLFPGQLFCRFSSILVAREPMVLSTPGVIRGKPLPVPIPDLEIERLRRIGSSQYPVECCALPQTGEIVEIPGDVPIQGVLVKRGSVCRVAIGFDVMGHTVALRVPLVDLKRVEGPLTPHWSLRAL